MGEIDGDGFRADFDFPLTGEIDGDGFRADLRTVGFRGSFRSMGDKVGLADFCESFLSMGDMEG